MYIRIVPVILFFSISSFIHAQTADTLKVVELDEIIIHDSYRERTVKQSALSVEVAGKELLEKHFTGNLMQALERVPGVRSMDVGSGFSKPMVRGMAFNRVSVAENGIKQEGQQWGADHGLEMDAFGVDQVVVRKGPSSLLYGSDAMGGVVEIVPLPPPMGNGVKGEVVFLGKTVNVSYGGSVMLAVKRNGWYTRLRISGQSFGDYKVPADTVIYLTRKLPVHGGKLKNTAGRERNVAFSTDYRKGRYQSDYRISNVFQKTGFFPGAHGIPDASRLEDDGSRRNIELPYSKVNHFKFTTRQQYIFDGLIGSLDLGYQNNNRQEWSLFHTHYGNQLPPEKDPDKELGFSLDTFSSVFRLRWAGYSDWEHSLSWDVQYQQNNISGYSFLLPVYRRFTTGAAWLSTWRLSSELSLSGGLRYDRGRVKVEGYKDVYLEEYLGSRGYDEATVDSYKWRSMELNRSFGDISGSIGMVWIPGNHLVKLNAGRSFRLPGANELASNGVHHGAFRHEQGNGSLRSEQGWQVDASYEYRRDNWTVSVSPFASWYKNYIYLKPTGEWSVLPHAGQIYRYTGAKVVLAGTEAMVTVNVFRWLGYSISGEYVYTYNRNENVPLSYSPPANLRNELAWKPGRFELSAEWQTVFRQSRVARNETVTPGANLLHIRLSTEIPVGKCRPEVNLSVNNIFNTKYYNHLSFYRRIEIPEPGRDIRFYLKVPF